MEGVELTSVGLCGDEEESIFQVLRVWKRECPDDDGNFADIRVTVIDHLFRYVF